MLLGQRLVDRRLEAPDMFHRHVLSLTVARLQILVQGGKHLGVQDLKSPNPVHHSFQLNSFNILVFSIHPLNPEYVVAEVETFKPPLLSEEGDHDSTRPVESLSEQLLHSELILSNWDAVDELQR